MSHSQDQTLEERVRALEAQLAATHATAAIGSRPGPDRPSHRLTRPRRSRAILAVLAVGLTIVAPAAVLAFHDFTDVPTTSTFHTTISNIRRAGLTAGCGGGKYCPADPVRRDSMSAFLNRGLGRGSASAFGEVELTGGFVTVADTTLAVPGAGWILVQADASAHTDDTTGCPCEITLEIKGPGLSNSLTLADRLWNAEPATITYAHLGTHHLFAVPAAGNHTFQVLMNRFTGSATVKADGEISAIWIPFGSHGEAFFGDSPQ